MNSTAGVTSGTSTTVNLVPVLGLPQGSCTDKPEESWEQETRKIFSKSSVKHKIEEYKAGKYSEKYIQVYLDFTHLEGIITNIEYLEFKNSLKD